MPSRFEASPPKQLGEEPLIKAKHWQRMLLAEHLTAVPATFSSCRKLWLNGNLSKDSDFKRIAPINSLSN